MNARVIATALDAAVGTAVVGAAACAVRADRSAPFIAVCDVSNSVATQR